MTVFMVLFDWSTDDQSEIEVKLFDTYDKAHDYFVKIINDELNPDLSWVADAFDNNGNVKEGYDFDMHDWGAPYDCWWNITDKNDYSRHDYLDLREMEVK